MAPDTPIQFDIISPVSEEHASQAKSGAQGRSVLQSLACVYECFKIIRKRGQLTVDCYY